MLEYSKANFLLYPYHLSDLFVKGLRMTPFNYYLGKLYKPNIDKDKFK